MFRVFLANLVVRCGQVLCILSAVLIVVFVILFLPLWYMLQLFFDGVNRVMDWAWDVLAKEQKAPWLF